jgi:hypothetical protein
MYILSIVILTFCSCGGNNSPSNVTAPGEDKTLKTKTLEAGANILQSKTPLNKFSTYLDGFHFYNGNMQGQMEAHHYVTQLNEDVEQAVIFDGNGENAKLMGIEYIISERLFKELPAEEKKLWHSHRYEVKSGTLIAPGITEVAEDELMEKIVSTYGKTIHTWHTDRDLELPLGSPMLMMGFTQEGQINKQLVDERDKRFNVSTADKKLRRKSLAEPMIIKGADAWEQGEVRQFVISKDSVIAKANSHH